MINPLKLYYKIWLGLAKSVIEKGTPEQIRAFNWKAGILIGLCFGQCYNIMTIESILRLFGINLYERYTLLMETVLSLPSILFFLVVSNYFLIFYKNRYEKIIIKYPEIKPTILPLLLYHVISGIIMMIVLAF